MKQILILKTASEDVMQRIFHEVLQMEAKIYCLVQNSVVEVYQKKYKNITVIDIEAETFDEQIFNFSKFDKFKFDEIYVPSSTPYFRNYDNIFFILDKLHYKNLILFDCYGNKKLFQKKRKLEEWVEYRIVKLLFHMFSFRYGIKTKMQGEK